MQVQELKARKEQVKKQSRRSVPKLAEKQQFDRRELKEGRSRVEKGNPMKPVVSP